MEIKSIFIKNPNFIKTFTEIIPLIKKSTKRIFTVKKKYHHLKVGRPALSRTKCSTLSKKKKTKTECSTKRECNWSTEVKEESCPATTKNESICKLILLLINILINVVMDKCITDFFFFIGTELEKRVLTIFEDVQTLIKSSSQVKFG